MAPKLGECKLPLGLPFGFQMDAGRTISKRVSFFFETGLLAWGAGCGSNLRTPRPQMSLFSLGATPSLTAKNDSTVEFLEGARLIFDPPFGIPTL